MLLNQALLFDESQLSNLCLDLIDKFCFEVLLTDYFLECDLQVLKLILKRDSLSKLSFFSPLLPQVFSFARI